MSADQKAKCPGGTGHSAKQITDDQNIAYAKFMQSRSQSSKRERDIYDAGYTQAVRFAIGIIDKYGAAGFQDWVEHAGDWPASLPAVPRQIFWMDYPFAEDVWRSGEPPTASAVATRRCDGSWSLVVPVCPICCGEHFHGGGFGDAPSFGHRASHCGRGDSQGYILVEAI